MGKIYFIRHGQASYMSDNYDKLSEKGIEQSKILGKYLVNRKIKFEKVYSGPLERQVHTYQLVRAAYEDQFWFPKAQIINGLSEHKGPEASRKSYPLMLEKYQVVRDLVHEAEVNKDLLRRNTLRIFEFFMDKWVSGEIEVEGIQCWKSFREKVEKARHQILREAKRGENIAVFSSGGTISSVTASSLNMEDDTRIAAMNFAAKNTSITSFMFSENKFNLLTSNETPHLTEEMVTFV